MLWRDAQAIGDRIAEDKVDKHPQETVSLRKAAGDIFQGEELNARVQLESWI